LTRLDQALGKFDEPLEPRRPPPAFRSRISFAEPIGRPEDIVAATSRLLAVLCKQFEQASVGARKLELALYRVDGSVDRTAIGTSRPNRDNPKLMKLFAEKLGELDPGFGVELIVLSAPEVEEWTGAQDSLPETGIPIQSSWREDGTIDLADRLAIRLGVENVIRLAPHDSHLPDRAQAAVPFMTPIAEGAWALLASMKEARPTRLLQRPEPVNVTALLPDGPPRQFQWHHHTHRVVKTEGPERVTREWWRPHPNDKTSPASIVPPVRDYYRVEDHEGSRFWLFRDGSLSTAKWYLHGFCA
jgi:protein ImuB